MLVLAVVALVMPAVVDLFAFGSLSARPEVVQRLSEWTAVVLLIVYCAGLVFAFTTNRDPLRRGEPRDPAPVEGRGDHSADNRDDPDDDSRRSFWWAHSNPRCNGSA